MPGIRKEDLASDELGIFVSAGSWAFGCRPGVVQTPWHPAYHVKVLVVRRDVQQVAQDLVRDFQDDERPGRNRRVERTPGCRPTAESWQWPRGDASEVMGPHRLSRIGS